MVPSTVAAHPCSTLTASNVDAAKSTTLNKSEVYQGESAHEGDDVWFANHGAPAPEAQLVQLSASSLTPSSSGALVAFASKASSAPVTGGRAMAPAIDWAWLSVPFVPPNTLLRPPRS